MDGADTTTLREEAEAFGALPAWLRHIVSTRIFESEVENGGYPQFFFNSQGFLIYAVLRGALDALWGRLIDGSEVKGPEALCSACMDLIPDPEEEEWTALTSSALDAASSSCELLQFVDDGDAGRIANVMEAAFEMVYMYAQEISPFDAGRPSLPQAVSETDLVQRELGRQEADLSFFEGSADTVDLGKLRRERRGLGFGSLDERT